MLPEPDFQLSTFPFSQHSSRERSGLNSFFTQKENFFMAIDGPVVSWDFYHRGNCHLDFGSKNTRSKLATCISTIDFMLDLLFLLIRSQPWENNSALRSLCCSKEAQLVDCLASIVRWSVSIQWQLLPSAMVMPAIAILNDCWHLHNRAKMWGWRFAESTASPNI